MKTQKSFKNVAFAFVFLFSIVSTALLAQDPKPTATPSEKKADEMTPGLIVLTGFEGDVKIASAKNPVGITPAAGAKLQMGDIILTGSNSSASLAFSNGSVLQVQSDSKFSIEEYLQKPWDFDEAAFKKLEKEPTASKTKLKLDYGDVICNVKKLSATSEMSVSTPLGVAGIRGTKFKLSITLDSNGKPTGSKLSVVEGKVALSSQGSGQAPLLVTSGLASSISVNPAAGGTFTIVFDAPLTKKDMAEITVIVDKIIKQIGEFVMSAIVAQEEIKKQEEAKKSEQGDQKPQDGEKKEDEKKEGQIDVNSLPSPNTGAASAASKAAANAAAAEAKAEAQTNALVGFKLSSGNVTYGALAPTITPATSTASSEGLITYSSSDRDVATVSGSTITIVGAGTTTITANQAALGLFPAASVTQTLTVGKKALKISGVSATNRAYDGTKAVALTGGSLVGVESGDTVTLDGTPSGEVASAAVGTGKAVTVTGYSLSGVTASNYSMPNQPTGVTVDITVALVTVTAASANKTFGDNDPTTLNYTANPSELITGNSFSGALRRATGEDARTYPINKGTLSAGNNYAITFVSANFTIKKGSQSITLPEISGKTYGDEPFNLNATSDSGLPVRYSSSDTSVATITPAGLVTIKSNGEATITASQAGNRNYNAATSVTATLTVGKKALTVSGAAVSTKVYDGTAVAQITGAQLVGVIDGDDVDVSDSDSSAAFADSNVGENKPVTTNGVLTGAKASRYTLTQPTGLKGNITAKALTISGVSASDRVYNGTTDVAVTGGALVGVESGDTVTLGGTATGTVASAAVGTDKSVTVAGYSLSGGDALNYSVTQPTEVNVDITVALVTVTAASANKNAGENDPTLSYTATPSVLIDGNSFSGSLTREAGENAGTYAINQGTLSAGDNYAITFVGATFTINNSNTTPVLTGFGVSPSSITYGDSAPTIIPPNSDSTGAITYTSSDINVATISGSTIVIVGVGTTMITVSQAASGTYDAALPVEILLTVSPKALTISGVAVSTKVYDGTPTAQITGAQLVGGIDGDVVDVSDSESSAVFADSNVGVNKQVTINGVLTGAQASRYTLTQPTGLTGTITKASVTVIAASANKTWEDTDPVLTYTATPSLIDGNSFTGNLTRDSGEDAGTYSIIIGSLSAGDNYSITFQPAIFTINKEGVTTTTLEGFNLDNHKVNDNGSRTVRIIVPTSNSPAPITYSLNPSGAGSINDSAVTLTDPCTISANQLGGLFDGVEYSAASASITLKWEKEIDDEFISNK